MKDLWVQKYGQEKYGSKNWATVPRTYIAWANVLTIFVIPITQLRLC